MNVATPSRKEVSVVPPYVFGQILVIHYIIALAADVEGLSGLQPRQRIFKVIHISLNVIAEDDELGVGAHGVFRVLRGVQHHTHPIDTGLQLTVHPDRIHRPAGILPGRERLPGDLPGFSGQGLHFLKHLPVPLLKPVFLPCFQGLFRVLTVGVLPYLGRPGICRDIQISIILQLRRQFYNHTKDIPVLGCDSDILHILIFLQCFLLLRSPVQISGNGGVGRSTQAGHQGGDQQKTDRFSAAPTFLSGHCSFCLLNPGIRQGIQHGKQINRLHKGPPFSKRPPAFSGTCTDWT